MTSFRFSPIGTHEELIKAITHVHFACFKLCYRFFGKYLPASGNLGIFTHFDDEFAFLTKLREEMTDININWNQKYYLLYRPVKIDDKRGDFPETTYKYLYIRRPDPDKPQVGDIDLVLDKYEFDKLRVEVQKKKVVNGVELFYRPDLNMIRLAADDTDALPYITTKFMNENVKES